MSAGRFDFTRAQDPPRDAEQGATFRHTITVQDENEVVIDLVNVTDIRLMVRQTEDAADPPLVTLSVGSGITISAPTTLGQFVVLISAAATAALPVGMWTYQIELDDLNGSGDTLRLLYGCFEITREVVR